MKRNRLRPPPRPRRKFNAGRLLKIISLLLLVAAGYFYLRDTTPPALLVTPDGGAHALKRPLQIELRDAGCGVKSVRVAVRRGDKDQVLLDRSFAGEATARVEIPLDKGTPDGPLEVLIEGRDAALFPFGRGNAVRKAIVYTIDNRPPRIELLSPATPVWQGGAATIVYKVDEAVGRSGVEANGLFFSGYRQASGVYLCVVPFPVDISPTTYKPKLVAVDLAGNETRVAPGLQLLPRKFPHARIPVSDKFIADKRDEFQRTVPDADGIELFLRMNRDIRKENRDKFIELAKVTSPAPLWSEPMLRMARSKTTGDYAEARDYLYNNRLVDRQTHLGTDLASVAGAPIDAANPGKVVFAGDLGIYGGCVVIDHGLGVQSVYGHLSAVETTVGAGVARGEQIGRSGKSGMAAGDHLHFEVVVGGIPVRPEEWMEKGWIETYILGPMRGR